MLANFKPMSSQLRAMAIPGLRSIWEPFQLKSPISFSEQVPVHPSKSPLLTATTAVSGFPRQVCAAGFQGISNGQSLADLSEMKAMHNAFGKDPRFEMINLSIDKDIATVRDFVKKHGLKWRQGFLGGTSKIEVMGDFGVTGIPALFLIGLDGKRSQSDMIFVRNMYCRP
jgi:hypothetical protein